MAGSRRSCSTSMASETWRGGSSVEETFTRALLLATGAHSVRPAYYENSRTENLLTSRSLVQPRHRAQPRAHAECRVQSALRSRKHPATSAAADGRAVSARNRQTSQL